MILFCDELMSYMINGIMPDWFDQWIQALDFTKPPIVTCQWEILDCIDTTYCYTYVDCVSR